MTGLAGGEKVQSVTPVRTEGIEQTVLIVTAIVHPVMMTMMMTIVHAVPQHTAVTRGSVRALGGIAAVHQTGAHHHHHRTQHASPVTTLVELD